MKTKKIVALALSAVMAMSMFAACSDAGDEGTDVVVIENGAAQAMATMTTAAPDAEGYAFDYNGTKVRVNTDMNAILSDLGDNYTYFEAASCAGLGMSKTYTYNNGSFIISTNPVDSLDVISNITLNDDTVSTAEGIYIGSTAEQVHEAYGDPTSETETTTTYELNDTMLVFIILDGVVTNIVYNAII